MQAYSKIPELAEVHAALAGRDLTSDADSPIARASWSGIVLKSMGAWRPQSVVPLLGFFGCSDRVLRISIAFMLY